MTMKNAALLVVLSYAAMGGCDEKSSEPAAAPSSASADKTGDAPANKGKRTKKDRGESSVMLGEVKLEDGTARFKVKEGKLKLSLVWSDYSGGQSDRKSVDLSVKDFGGPGSYEVEPMSSRFIGVGFDADSLRDAKDEETAEKEALKAISGAKHMMLTGAKVEITSASDDEISGTFSWAPPQGLDKPALEKGTFRAVKRKKRKK